MNADDMFRQYRARVNCAKPRIYVVILNIAKRMYQKFKIIIKKILLGC